MVVGEWAVDDGRIPWAEEVRGGMSAGGEIDVGDGAEPKVATEPTVEAVEATEPEVGGACRE